MSFELYCVEIEDIPYYNFLTEEEFDCIYTRYEKWLKTQ